MSEVSPYAGQDAGGSSADRGTTNGIVIAACTSNAIPTSTSNGRPVPQARARTHHPRRLITPRTLAGARPTHARNVCPLPPRPHPACTPATPEIPPPYAGPRTTCPVGSG
ncbi:hypothetical protein JCM4814A_15410 [Streptomyces phaeofaciens JCM 4814]|uniref:Uncharacterized protein n=1 Tax=Streptomyces phaeofaciens TaxID=68254 RepID=A0A918LYI0_9ACTN|nr:hypothetical protein GCM10010226_62320 [Streptomyces phaeofaciens]